MLIAPNDIVPPNYPRCRAGFRCCCEYLWLPLPTGNEGVPIFETFAIVIPVCVGFVTVVAPLIVKNTANVIEPNAVRRTVR